MKKHLILARFILLLSTSVTDGIAQSITMFDTDILRARGISDSVAIYLQGSSRFYPGINHPTLVVNGNKRGTIPVTFNNKGDLCVNDMFLKAAGIFIPKSNESLTLQDHICKSLPIGINVKLQPGLNRVEILVPPQWIDDNNATKKTYVNGGSAALLNYNFYITNGNNGLHQRSNKFYAYTESGFNFDNWIVRSYDSYSSQCDSTKFQHQAAWIQRTFNSLKSTLQAGQLTLNNPLFSAPSFNGIQVMQENALIKTNNNVQVIGISYSNSMVKVHQGGVLIYSTLVPSGKFILNNLPLNNFSQDLEVTIIENNGWKRRFIVSASSFISNFTPIQESWTFAIGQPRNTRNGLNNLKSYGFITASFPIKTSHSSNITTGIMLAQHYTSAGLNAKIRLWKGTSTYLRFLAAKDRRTGTKGIITQAGHSMALGDTLLATLSTSFYTLGFRYLTDIPQSNVSRYNQQQRFYSANLGWNNKILGYFSIGLVRTKRFDNTIENYPTLNWSRNIGSAHVSINISSHNNEHVDNMYYLNVNLPLGKIYTNFSANKEGNNTNISTNINHKISDTISYSIGTSVTNNNKYHDFNSSIYLQSRYGRIYGNYNYNGHENHSWSISMNGSMIHDGYGMLFSPYSVRDTFGVISVIGLDNAQIATSAGTVWTNKNGRAVVPSVTPYNQSYVELINQGLPRNVEVNNLRSVTKASRGSVSNFSLKVKRNRKILLQVTDQYGNLFQQGMAVLDKHGRYLSITGADSYIYLDRIHIRNGLLIEDDNGNRCALSLRVNTKQLKEDEPYEIVSVPAVCR